MTTYHISVLLNELLHYFSEQHLRIFIDGTLGAGGHAEAFLKAHPEIELYIGIDQDPVAREIAEKRLAPWKHKLKIIPDNFSNLENILTKANIDKVDGMIFDLGVSSMQLDQAEKGFSFMKEGPLDMRMNPDNRLTAAEIINTWSENDLARIFRDYGEEKKWRYAAHLIALERQEKPFATTTQLADFLRQKLFTKKKGFHPATLIFQALRICVNGELEVVEKVLPVVMDHLVPGGRLGVISFHSLEDRIVKNFMRYSADDKIGTSSFGTGLFLDKEPIVHLITRKPVEASEEEIRLNPRSRSAKLRVIEKR